MLVEGSLMVGSMHWPVLQPPQSDSSARIRDVVGIMAVRLAGIVVE